MKNCLLPLLLLLLPMKMYTQDSLSKTPSKLVLDFPLLELPHLRYAADMRYNKSLDKLSGGKTNPTANDYLSGFESLSMQQALAITKNLHSTNYYLNNKLWNKSVSYTHLDVYKRQCLLYIGFSDEMKAMRFFAWWYGACLLYTSRCV